MHIPFETYRRFFSPPPLSEATTRLFVTTFLYRKCGSEKHSNTFALYERAIPHLWYTEPTGTIWLDTGYVGCSLICSSVSIWYHGVRKGLLCKICLINLQVRECQDQELAGNHEPSSLRNIILRATKCREEQCRGLVIQQPGAALSLPACLSMRSLHHSSVHW